MGSVLCTHDRSSSFVHGVGRCHASWPRTAMGHGKSSQQSQNAHAYTALLVTHQPRRRVFVYALSGVHAACRLSFVTLLELAE
jgi:hypothetical protein